jgi:hypothetical protein
MKKKTWVGSMLVSLCCAYGPLHASEQHDVAINDADTTLERVAVEQGVAAQQTVADIEKLAGYAGKERRYIEIPVVAGFASTRSLLEAFVRHGDNSEIKQFHDHQYKIKAVYGTTPEAFLNDAAAEGRLINRSTNTKFDDELLSVYQYIDTDGVSYIFGILFEKIT